MRLKKFTLLATVVFVLQQISIAQTGQWKLTGNSLTGTQKLGSINGADLPAGTYTYTLAVNGKTSASKKMVLIK